MVDINIEADRLLEELGFLDTPSSSSSSSVPAPPPPAGSAPPPPAPPPPPPARNTPAANVTSGGNKKDIKKAQKEINDVFDSVISFAGKASNRKKTPPPVAPKPKRKLHVSSFTVNIGLDKPSDIKSLSPVKPAETNDVKIVPSMPVETKAFGPGLESLEVSTPGTFELITPEDTRERDIDIKVVGPSGSKSVDVENLGGGAFSCQYIPSVAGDHKVTIKVNGKEVKGSPFTASVKYATFTDKAVAEGYGLVGGTTDTPSKFIVRLNENAGFTRMRVHILGPSKAEPVEMVEMPGENAIEVTYHPSAPGDYVLRVLWGEAHVKGSPFNVPVTGPIVNDPSKVLVIGDGLKGGNVGQDLTFFVEGQIGAGPGPLAVRMIGPSKPTLIADDSSEAGVAVSFTCRDPGEYQLIVKWGEEELPNSPFSINITGEGREIKPELCVADGDGICKGKVSETAEFTVTVPDEAGPGSLGVSISGPHPPKPIEIVNNLDGTMKVTYLPLAPGEYRIEVTWGNAPIKSSPFISQITGNAIRNPQAVTASGSILNASMITGQLGTIIIVPGEGSGAGPLRAKMEGPSKADLHLASTPQQTFEASFCPKDPGTYKLYLMWGDGNDDDSQINGSPFTIKVENK